MPLVSGIWEMKPEESPRQSPLSKEIKGSIALGKAVLPLSDHQMAPDTQLCLPPWREKANSPLEEKLIRI